jgi:hypothetical protein
MKWITRERPKIDRMACPWLIARFIDRQPEFLFVPADQVLPRATETGSGGNRAEITTVCDIMANLSRSSFVVCLLSVNQGEPVMKKNAIWLAVLGLFLLAADDPAGRSLSFKDAKVGELPKGWTAAKTGKGEGSVWKIVEDESSPDGGKALAQVSADGPNALFNLCVAGEPKLADVDLTISFKAVAGKADQGGGPVWRYQDANNYYVCRMNPLEDNFRVYKVVSGKRTQLGTADVEAAAGKWHTIRIVHKGDRIQCHLNGKLLLDVKDTTFKDAGQIGLWSKADAQTRFAGIKVTGE